ncbi:hypothetical protein [Nocardia sp. NBC_01327]|uniref:hypothetical protein n=1 Tax=Nocardia sp. NBC_01327 TaxID=2903593 RepID=UPI002E0E4F57|nr:hypothetical protein OG326_23570 [Nocardia sp. NBC_01327]
MSTKITLEITVWDDDELGEVEEAVRDLAADAEADGCAVRVMIDGIPEPALGPDDSGYGGSSYFAHAMGKD